MLAGREAGTDDPYLFSLPTPTPPRSSPAPSLPLSRQRTLRSQRATNQHWGAFYINDKVWARGAGGGGRRGRGPTKLPAGCSKIRARQGRADVSCRLAKAWQPNRVRRACQRGVPYPLGQAGPSYAAIAGSREPGVPNLHLCYSLDF